MHRLLYRYWLKVVPIDTVFLKGGGSVFFLNPRPPSCKRPFKVTAPPRTIVGDQEPNCHWRREFSLRNRNKKNRCVLVVVPMVLCPCVVYNSAGIHCALYEK